MKIRLYLDEDVMAGGLIPALRTRGVDIITVRDTHLEGATDEHQLDYATEHGCVLYSFNIKHYMALHTAFLEQGKSHKGIILAEQSRRYSVGEQTRRLLRLIAEKSAEEMQDQVVFLSNWG
jgi:Domain of unknown function (DUF5615)